MKKIQDSSGIFLAVVTGVAVLGMLLVRAFFPRIILPEFGLSFVLTLTLVALVAEHYLARNRHRDYRLVPLYGAVIFGLFSLAGLIVLPTEALRLALMGVLVFTATTFLFDSVTEHLSEAPIAKAAPVVSAFGLYLAAQGLIGIFG